MEEFRINFSYLMCGVNNYYPFSFNGRETPLHIGVETLFKAVLSTVG